MKLLPVLLIVFSFGTLFTAQPSSATDFALNPTSGPVGTVVSISGSSYAGTTCTLSATPSSLFSSSSCLLSSGTLTGSFTVTATGASASYIVTVMTDAGELANATFYLINDIFSHLTLSLASGGAGTVVLASVSGFVGTTCALSSTPVGLFASPSCSISGGTLKARFTVAPAAPPGNYVVTVTTDKSQTVSAIFTVATQGYLSVNFDKATYYVGDTVHIAGGEWTPTCTWTYTSAGGLAVAITIYDPDGRLVLNYTTNPSAAGFKDYAYDYVLPANTDPGNYTVAVSYGSCGGWCFGCVFGQGTFLVTPTTAPLTSPATTPVTTPPGPGIPGFSIEAILIGLVGGLVALTLVRRGRSVRHQR